MSANIPFEIQTEIIKRILPVKSLIRFRSVSKKWKSLIDSSEFISHHSLNHTPPLHHLLVSYYADSEYKYVSIVDDASFPQHRFPLDDSPTLKLLSYTLMFDCSHGLVFLYGESVVLQKNLIVLWNPSIRKSVAIVFEYDPYVVGFGVCPKTGDPKIVKITDPDEFNTDWEVEVFTLSSRAWRTISMNLQKPFKKDTSHSDQVVIDGVVHWLAGESVATGYIVSFDLTSEEFGEVDLPNRLKPGCLFIFKLKESLALLNQDEIGMSCDVWMMIKYGDLKSSFAKLFKFRIDSCDGLTFCHPIGFRKNGQLIREKIRLSLTRKTLEVYEPCTGNSYDLGFDLNKTTFRMTSYTESLLLLNHPDSVIQG